MQFFAKRVIYVILIIMLAWKVEIAKKFFPQWGLVLPISDSTCPTALVVMALHSIVVPFTFNNMIISTMASSKLRNMYEVIKR